MGQLNLQIATRRDDATLKKAFETPGASAKEAICNKIAAYIVSVLSGTELGPTGSAPSIAVSIEGQAVAASGTLTVSSTGSTATQTCSIAGVTFTAVASGATGNQFNVSTTPTTQAASMVTAINASTSLAGIVTAANVAGVVTISSAVKGKVGNGIALSAGTLSNVVASGALLTAGAADSTALTLSF